MANFGWQNMLVDETLANHACIPGCRRSSILKLCRRYTWEDGVPVNLVSPATTWQTNQSRHQTSIACKSWFCVIVVGTDITEPIILVRTRDHGSSHRIRVRILAVPPFPSSLATVLDLVLGNGNASVVNLSRVVGPVPDHVAHVLRIGAQDVINLSQTRNKVR